MFGVLSKDIIDNNNQISLEYVKPTKLLLTRGLKVTSNKMLHIHR